MSILQIIENKLKQTLVEGRTLIYFASGSVVRDSYRDLPYRNVLLVDNALKRDHIGRISEIPRLIVDDGIICLGMDCIQAIQLLKNIDWKIDCMVAINEGLYEGGGYYSLNSDIFLGLVFPILADTCIHIGYKEYYSGPEYYHQRTNWLNLPFENRDVLKETDNGYIYPVIFTDNKKYSENAEVTLLSIKSGRHHSLVNKGKTITVKHTSIWNETESLDAVFVRFENKRQKELLLKAHRSSRNVDLKIYPIKVKFKTNKYTTYNLDTILAMSEDKKWKNIGIVPSDNNYLRFVEKVFELETDYPETITIYHLNKDDFHDLYKL